MTINNYKYITSDWFLKLRDQICLEFEQIEAEFGADSTFSRKKWEREGGGGGEMSQMRGEVFEKVGVNISTVYGEFSPEFRKSIPGCEVDPTFHATGISLVAHPRSPHVPAVHMNTRFITTTKSWFGGGADLTPIYPQEEDTEAFHNKLKEMCNLHNKEYYPKFKAECDEYFHLKHRNEPRGVGGIFFDYLNNNNFDADFAFVKDVGTSFCEIYSELVRKNMHKAWSPEERAFQLKKRGRYVEFNLLYDRGTKFGLMTGGNTEAILMSLPPIVEW